MYGRLRGSSWYDGATAVDSIAATRALLELGHDDPILLAFWPSARLNPYQSLLYRSCWDHGIAPMPLESLDYLDAVLDITGTDVAPVLHLHWTLEVLRGVENRADARRAADRFVAVLDSFLVRGGRIVWTVHNVIPHDSPFPDIDADIQQAVVDRAEVVHVLAQTTSEIVAPYFAIPASKVVHVPHPHYVDAYPDTVNREQARFEIGALPGQTVWAAVGAIRPYKGLEDLVDAFDVLSQEEPGRHVLVVAGSPGTSGDMAELLERCAEHPNVLLRTERIVDADMQRYLKAADIAVLPYRRTLNSGVLLLALSFGVPVVVSSTGAGGEIVDESCAREFVGGDVDDLVRAMREARALCNDESRKAALERALAYDPTELATRFADELHARLRSN